MKFASLVFSIIALLNFPVLAGTKMNTKSGTSLSEIENLRAANNYAACVEAGLTCTQKRDCCRNKEPNIEARCTPNIGCYAQAFPDCDFDVDENHSCSVTPKPGAPAGACPTGGNSVDCPTRPNIGGTRKTKEMIQREEYSAPTQN